MYGLKWWLVIISYEGSVVCMYILLCALFLESFGGAMKNCDRLFCLQAFGWAYLNNWHNTWDQLYVYWICPFAGAILAAWLFRAIFPPPPPPELKQKKAWRRIRPFASSFQLLSRMLLLHYPFNLYISFFILFSVTGLCLVRKCRILVEKIM